MNIEQIKDNYSQLTIEKLKALCKDLNGLQPEAIPFLQQELFSRGEKEEALNITRHLISNKYIIADDDMFDYLLKQLDEKLTESEIDNRLKSVFDFDLAHIEIIKAKFKEKGKESFFLGLGLILVPLTIALVVIILSGQIAGLLVIIFIYSGIIKATKGYKQMIGFKQTKSTATNKM